MMLLSLLEYLALGFIFLVFGPLIIIGMMFYFVFHGFFGAF